MTLAEPDVALTDWVLALECGVFAYLIRRGSRPGQPSRGWLLLFFGAGSLAALAGGTVHGFFPDGGSAGARILWPATLGLIGLSGLAAWGIGASLQLQRRAARRLVAAAALALVAYAGALAYLTQAFVLAIAYYLPAALFLLVVFLLAWRRTQARELLVAALGLVTTFLAAAIQLAGVGLHPRYFNHNALYHLVQALGLFMIFRGARWLVRAGRTE
ncbi:MAG: hypothetical protein HY727_13625 [Candidatus Rokubacteria bacterium]|nr:hypothetical protein [Candidatus Rokubacteria bacterium]